MADPIPLFPHNEFAPTDEDKARFLELLATDVRSGRRGMQKAVLIYMDEAGDVEYVPFGDRTNYAELAGLVAFGQQKIISSV